MASTVRYGSSGDDVRRLQQALNGAGGYGLAVDGVFGNKTQQALRSYQQARGLNVDGIAGPQTWASFGGGGATGAAAAAQATANTTNPDQTAGAALRTPEIAQPTQAQPDAQTDAQADALGMQPGQTPTFQQTAQLSAALDQMVGGMPGNQGYTPSQDVQDALAAVNAAAGARPEPYQSRYQETLDRLYNEALNRPGFSYDYSADPLYMAYRDRYTANARQAMQDSMANAAALTGGYGNSYAAAAGQQAYDQHMQGLNDALPELYSQAYGRYRDEYEDLLRQMQLTQGMDETDYGRWADTLSDYYNNLSAQRALANDAYSRDYGQYTDQLAQRNTDRAFAYNLYQDELARELAAEAAAAAASGGGSGGRSGRSSGGSGGRGVSTGGDYKTILAAAKNMTAQKAYDYIGRMVDGGYITPEQGERILGLELGLDLSKYAGGSTSGAASAGNTDGLGYFERLAQTINTRKSALDDAVQELLKRQKK